MTLVLLRTGFQPCLPLKASSSPRSFQLRARKACSNVTAARRTVASAAAAAVPNSTPETPPPAREMATTRHHSPQITHRKPLTAQQKEFLDAALRVNHAGELAATLIYTAQSSPINRAHPHLRPLMRHMYDQEAGHLRTFSTLLARHRIRPTAMYPVWAAVATVLGWSTGVMGREAAMACTEAVETEIGEHYNNQVRELLAWAEKMERNGETIGDELRGLVREIRRIRDEELEHLDHAVEHDAKEANPYELLTGIIRYGCKGAIWVSERI
ncbi:hypothetical protein M433DRAFT_156568 [Acidomyces richmondensis BFW]|nr:MAG: hypothetical protein FE78DRAFT_93827 [Acidomyces sp. 'richmondensis']KYG43570.1 hypothetical protein M433DRAFT_156568 [Acidomyces richmondensis BFW]